MFKHSYSIFFLILLFLPLTAQNYNTPAKLDKKTFNVGVYPTFLNYNSRNHLHLEFQGDLLLNNRQQLIFTGGFGNGDRFEVDFQQLIVSEPLDLAVSGGIGSFYGAFIDLDAMLGFKLGNNVYLNNQLQVHLYLDNSDNFPFESDSPMWYAAGLSVPMSSKTMLCTEFGLPLVSGSYTWFGMGLMIYL